jgi:VanZ family protein
MSSNRGRAAFWISTWWPVAVVVGVIVIESTILLGADHTSGPLRRLCQFFFGHAIDRSWDEIHHFIRKSGHFIGYGFLGLSWWRAWWRTFSFASFSRCFVLSVLGTFLVAGADELHQSFLPNRSGAFTDVCLDSLGAIAFISACYLILHIFHRRSLLIRSAASSH